MRIDFSETFWRTASGIFFWNKHTRYSMRALFLKKGFWGGLRRIIDINKQKNSNQKFYLSIVVTVRNGHPNQPYTSEEFNDINKYSNVCEETMPVEIVNEVKRNLANL